MSHRARCASATFHSCHFMAASSSRCALAMHESFNLVNVYKNVLNEIDRQWRQIRSVYSFKCVQWITVISAFVALANLRYINALNNNNNNNNSNNNNRPQIIVLGKMQQSKLKMKTGFFSHAHGTYLQTSTAKIPTQRCHKLTSYFCFGSFITCLSENLVQTVYRRILSNSTRKLLWFEITKMLIAV